MFPILFGSALSSIKLMAAGGLAAIAFSEFSRRIGTRRREHARGLAWLANSTPAAARWDSDRSAWVIRRPDGSELLCPSKALAERYLDHAENAARIAGDSPPVCLADRVKPSRRDLDYSPGLFVKE